MPPASTPITFGHLATASKWLQYSLIPLVAFIIAAVIWVHDTDATVTKLDRQQPAIDTILQRLDKRTEVLDYKVDLLLEDRRGKTR